MTTHSHGHSSHRDADRVPVSQPRILIVSPVHRADALRAHTDPCGWTIYHETGTLAALGAYLHYLPHLTVLDAVALPGIAWETAHHLRSIDAAPLLMLTEDSPVDLAINTLPPETSAPHLVAAIGSLLAVHYVYPGVTR